MTRTDFGVPICHQFSYITLTIKQIQFLCTLTENTHKFQIYLEHLSVCIKYDMISSG